MRCVQMILGCKGAPPYLVHGPPGTGKTLTLVEAILQLYTTRKNARILVCAPSNCAADHILEKLLGEESVEICDNDVFRLNESPRQYDDVKKQLFRCPPRNALVRHRIVVSPYTSTSPLYAEDIKHGHFSHIFLDEAGQASEPETIIPISNLYLRKTVVVLAGDPMQLGPVIYSKKQKNLEWVNHIWKGFLNANFTTLTLGMNLCNKVRNYRCHPDILHLPSTLFYRAELIACKDENSFLTDTEAILEVLPSKEYPVLFFGIQGCDEREGNNPSWFNQIEDKYWSKLLWQCVDKDSYKGCPLPERQDPTDEQHQCNNEELQSSGFEVAAADQNREEPPPPELEFSKPFIDEADWEDGWK